MPSGRDPRLRGKVLQTTTLFSKYMPQDYISLLVLYGYIIIKTFASDGLLYVYKTTLNLLKLYWHVSVYNNIIYNSYTN